MRAMLTGTRARVCVCSCMQRCVRARPDGAGPSHLSSLTANVHMRSSF